MIPLTTHTSYGYIFNRDLSERSDAERDFDALLSVDGVTEFESRADIRFPNFVHRRIYDGAAARIGNAAGFFEPLEATAIMLAQLQVGMILQARLNRPAEHRERDASVINRFLINSMLCCGLFVGWHYNCGSRYDNEFRRYARDRAWPTFRQVTDPAAVDCDALSRFDDMIGLISQEVVDKEDWTRARAVFPLSSYAQIAQGLGCYPGLDGH